MAAKRRRTTKPSVQPFVERRRNPPQTVAGPRGPRGKPGAPGKPANGELQKLAAQVNEVVKELQVQLTRIAQIQVQLDRMAAGQPHEPRRDRETERTDH